MYPSRWNYGPGRARGVSVILNCSRCAIPGQFDPGLDTQAFPTNGVKTVLTGGEVVRREAKRTIGHSSIVQSVIGKDTQESTRY